MNDKPKWIPGPWEVRTFLGNSRIFSSVTDLPVADVLRSPQKDVEREEHHVAATVRLIAAAPELYEALLNLVATIELEGADGPRFFDARESALSTLAKARGEA